LIIIIVFHHIQFSSSSSQLNSIKYGEKDATKLCELNLYHASKHDTYRFQYLAWPF
jgi:steroid 5-alpha reductase family enzyme